MTATEVDRPLSILLLCDDDPNHAAMILDHIDALVNLSRHNVYIFNCRLHPGDEALDLNEFDVVVIHYTLFVASDAYLAPIFRQKIRAFQGLKIQFIQDDYRAVDTLTREMRHMGIDVLYTLVPESQHGRIWTSRLPGVELVTWTAGYIADRLVNTRVPALRDRPIDVGYRGRVMPYWFGELAHDKARIGQGFLERTANTGLKCDISCREEDRLYGNAWDRFNSRCKTMLGCGSGATIADFDGRCEAAVRAYLAEHPAASFDEVAADVLQPWEGNIDLNVISPRQFEAIAARTALILFPGKYSGILQPDVHYIPLARDFANIDDVVAQIRDVAHLEAMANRAYDEVVASGRYGYAQFVRSFDDLVRRRHKPGHRALSSKAGFYRARRSFRQRIQTFCFRAINAVEVGQPLRVGTRVGKRHLVCTLPGATLQKIAVRALQRTWRLCKGLNVRPQSRGETQ